MRYIVGIDEAGRGPLAGPVAVAAVLVERGFNKNFFHGIKDSKQLTAEERELWFGLALEEEKTGRLHFSVSLVKETIIDRHGIAHAVRLGIKRCLNKLGVKAGECQVFLDGALRAPPEFAHQLTVIRGDEKIPVISLASIIAKETRDKRMVRLSKKFPQFGFESNKGYGTYNHRKAILEHGRSAIHRRSFLRHLTRETQL